MRHWGAPGPGRSRWVVRMRFGVLGGSAAGFGDGRINAFNPATGKFLGQLRTHDPRRPDHHLRAVGAAIPGRLAQRHPRRPVLHRRDQPRGRRAARRHRPRAGLAATDMNVRGAAGGAAPRKVGQMRAGRRSPTRLASRDSAAGRPPPPRVTAPTGGHTEGQDTGQAVSHSRMAAPGSRVPNPGIMFPCGTGDDPCPLVFERAAVTAPARRRGR